MPSKYFAFRLHKLNIGQDKSSSSSQLEMINKSSNFSLIDLMKTQREQRKA